MHYIFIKLNYPNGIGAEDFPLRYILSDTIVDRKLGKIINEGTGENYMEICVLLEQGKNTYNEILSIIESLGLKNYAELKLEED